MYKRSEGPTANFTIGARNPNLQVFITHASHVCSQHSFGLPLRMKFKTLLLEHCACLRFTWQMVRTRVIRSKFVMCIPFILSGSPNKCWLHTCDAWSLTTWPGLLEAWLLLTSVKYHGNLYILIPLNQRLALTRLRATGPWRLGLRAPPVARNCYLTIYWGKI